MKIQGAINHDLREGLQHYFQGPTLPESPLADWLRLVQILAIVISGIAAYVKFFHGRLFWPRLEPSLTASIIQSDQVFYLKVDSCLKNVGLSSVPIQRKGTSLVVYEAENIDLKYDIQKIRWREVGSYRAFEDHQWIESGESITDENLIAVRNDKQYVFRVDLEIYCTTRSLLTLYQSRETEWVKSTIVFTENHKPDKSLVLFNGARGDKHATS